MYNPTDEECTFNVALSTFELKGTTEVRDLINRKDEKSVKDSIRFKVVPHGVKILRLKGKERVEPIRYEAEQAYLNQFDDLAKRKRGVVFMPFDGASGRMTVANLGGHVDNYAQWDEVYSEKGGEYKMTIYYVPIGEGRSRYQKREIKDYSIEVGINDDMLKLKNLETDRAKGIQKVECSVKLLEGYNVIRMGSRFTWSPDLDCFTLEPLN